MATAWMKFRFQSKLKSALLDLPKPNLKIKRTVFHHFGVLEANSRMSKNARIVRRQRNPPEFPPLNRSPPRLSVKIPNRVNRSSTAILEALSTTVGRDPTSPGYRFMDDPFFIPATAANKRIYALSKESGRRAARYIVEKNPELFRKPHSDPDVPAFDTSVLMEFKVPANPTELDITNNLKLGKVTHAVSVYRAMKAQSLPVSPEMQQELLEWLCFYNGEDAEYSEFLDEEWFKAFSQQEMRKKWKKDGAAEEVFNDLPEKTPEAYAAIVCGMAKYINVESARTFFEEMEQKNMPIPLPVYNEMIKIIPMLQETYEARWEMALMMLNKMRITGVSPNVRTFNALLEMLAKNGGWRSARQLSLQIMSEMKQLNTEPSLASYNFLLQIFCRDRGPVSHILTDIMQELEGKTLKQLDPNDSSFFTTAMEVAARHLQDPAVGKRVHSLLNRDRHDLFINDSQKENIYYNNFFKTLVVGESVDGFFQQYDDLVPMTFTPDSNLVIEIIRMLEFHDRLDHLPRIWADSVLFGHSLRENVVESFLQTMINNQKPDLAAQFAVIAQDIRERIDNQPENRDKKLLWSGQIVGDICLLFVRNGDLDSTWQLLTKYLSQRGIIYGFPSTLSLNEVVNALLERKDLEKIKDCLTLAADTGLVEITERIDEIAEKLSLSQAQLAQLKSLIGTSAIDLSDSG